MGAPRQAQTQGHRPGRATCERLPMSGEALTPGVAHARLAHVSTNHRDAAQAFRVTLDLFETGVALMRQNLRRQDPSATEEEIDRRLAAWLHHRPGAELGDAVGQPPARPRWS
jgi:hypothetical protein